MLEKAVDYSNEIATVFQPLVFKALNKDGYFNRANKAWNKLGDSFGEQGKFDNAHAAVEKAHVFGMLDVGDGDAKTVISVLTNNVTSNGETQVAHCESTIAVTHMGYNLENRMVLEIDFKKFGDEWTCTKFNIISSKNDPSHLGH